MNEKKEAIQPGDVVRLKSGGPAMTVSSLESGNRVFCIWFSRSDSIFYESKSDTFKLETLKLCEKPGLD